MIRRFIDWNMSLSNALYRFLPADYVIDGNTDFQKNFASKWLKANARVIDIGGGKRPFVAPEIKNALAIHVSGVDISAQELERAPAGAYDRTICADISRTIGTGDADVCICQAVLEHVPDVASAFNGIASFLKPGGVALIWVPSRNAAFARLNLLLPERIKRFLLFTIFPETRRGQGFPSYYNKCTPADFRSLAQSAGLEVMEAGTTTRTLISASFFPCTRFGVPGSFFSGKSPANRQPKRLAWQ